MANGLETVSGRLKKGIAQLEKQLQKTSGTEVELDEGNQKPASRRGEAAVHLSPTDAAFDPAVVLEA